MGPAYCFDDLISLSGLPLTIENIEQNKESLREWLLSIDIQKEIKDAKSAVEYSVCSKEAMQKGVNCYDLQTEKQRKYDERISKLRNFLPMRDAIQAIEEVSQTGTKVYVSAGNQGSNYFNIYGLAKGTIVVKALDENGIPISRFSHLLATASALGSYRMTKIMGDNGIGFDIDNDGRIDIPAIVVEETGDEDLVLRGTSFAVPKRITDVL